MDDSRHPSPRTETGDISSSKSNFTKSEDTDNTVIQKPSSSSQDTKVENSSPTRSSEIKESEKTDHTSSRQESIKKAKARFLESDI